MGVKYTLSSSSQKLLLKNTILPLLNAYHVTRSVSVTSTQKFFKLANKKLDNALFKSWRGPDMYVTQYIYFQMKISFKFIE